MHLHSIQRQGGGWGWGVDYCRKSYHSLWMKAFLIRHGDIYWLKVICTLKPGHSLTSHAPNYNDQSFIQEIFLQVSESSGDILIGRDFNFCLDPVPDRSSDTAVIRSTAARSISAFMKSLNLCDTWRHFYPTTRHHFYSYPHTSHTRGDWIPT